MTDGWIVNGGTPTSQINGGAGVAITPSNPQGNLFVPQDFDTRVLFENRQRIGGTLVLQYQATDDLTITADSLFSRFSDTTDARSYGHWFTPSNLSDVVTDGNGTAIDMTQSVGQATDFHDEKFDKQTYTGDAGLNVDWKLSDRISLNLDGSYSRAREFPNGGTESELALLGYNNQTIGYHSDGAILPYTTGFIDRRVARTPVSWVAPSSYTSTSCCIAAMVSTIRSASSVPIWTSRAMTRSRAWSTSG